MKDEAGGQILASGTDSFAAGSVGRDAIQAKDGGKVHAGSGNIVDQKIDVAGDYIKVEASYLAGETAFNALHQMPRPPVDFTGREAELTELRDMVRENGAAISGLQGMGGIGKTALALVLADELKSDYPDAQLYIDLKGSEATSMSSSQALAQLIRAFHPTNQLPEGEAELQGIYRNALGGQRALILLDNAANGQQVRPLVPPEGSFLLVTSRKQFTLPGLQAMRLDKMEAADAEALLLKITPRIGGRAAELAKLCDYLPLALKLAASALQVRTELGVSAYVERLRDTRLETLDAPLNFTDEERGIAASLGLSYNLLDEDLRRKWRQLAVFPENFDTGAAAGIWNGLKVINKWVETGMAMDELRRTQDCLGEMLRYSLLNWSGINGRYRLHDLARLYAQVQLHENEVNEAYMRHAVYYLSCLEMAENRYKKGGKGVLEGLEMYDQEVANILSGQAWVMGQPEGNEDARWVRAGYALGSPQILTLRMDASERVIWMEAARGASIAMGDIQGEGQALNNLGLAYTELGQPEKAANFFDQGLEIARKMGDRSGESQTLNNLGLAYVDLGSAKKAINTFKQSLEIVRETGNRWSEGNVLGNLANVYNNHEQPEMAIQYFKQVLETMRESGDQWRQALTLGNLGNAYKNLGHWGKASEYHERALKMFKVIGDHRREGQTLINLGISYKKMGQVEKAKAHYEQAVEILRVLGDVAGEANASWNLGLIFEERGELALAIDAMQVLVDYEREIGHPLADQDAARVGQIRKKLLGG
ncbi:MAG: tetratricopeptide repeat protein [Anaerolineae bacterium]|nr:tetratricopeptide repeat protein [Anaerolineae bacterium]